MESVAVLICDNLELNMARAMEIFLHIQPVVAKRGPRFALCNGKSGREFRQFVDDSHSTPATAGSSLQQDGKSLLETEFARFVFAADCTLRPWHGGNPRGSN